MSALKNTMVAAALLGMGFCAQPMMASAAAQLSIQSERAAHPRLVDAIHRLQEGLRELEAAPDDFGGNKAVAIADMRKAIHSLKRALYYRLKMDDAAIDNVQ